MLAAVLQCYPQWHYGEASLHSPDARWPMWMQEFWPCPALVKNVWGVWAWMYTKSCRRMCGALNDKCRSRGYIKNFDGFEDLDDWTEAIDFGWSFYIKSVELWCTEDDCFWFFWINDQTGVSEQVVDFFQVNTFQITISRSQSLDIFGSLGIFNLVFCYTIRQSPSCLWMCLWEKNTSSNDSGSVIASLTTFHFTLTVSSPTSFSGTCCSVRFWTRSALFYLSGAQCCTLFAGSLAASMFSLTSVSFEKPANGDLIKHLCHAWLQRLGVNFFDIHTGSTWFSVLRSGDLQVALWIRLRGNILLPMARLLMAHMSANLPPLSSITPSPSCPMNFSYQVLSLPTSVLQTGVDWRNPLWSGHQ